MANVSLQESFKNRNAALTFDDVLLMGARASFPPSEVSLATRFSRHVPLLVPIVGAAMSAVSGFKMAIALAKLGGIASIPRSLDPEAQAKAVGRVKHSIHGFVDEPITADANEKVEDLLKRRVEKDWDFDSFPVLDTQGQLLGIITHSDFKRCDDLSLKVGQVMTSREKLVVAKQGVSMQEAYKTLKASDKSVLPVLRNDGTLAGIYTLTDLKRNIAGTTTPHNTDAQGRLRVAAAVGAGDEALMRAELLVEKGVDVLHIDMANGWQDFVFDTGKKLKDKYKNGPDIVIGNFAVAKAAREVADEVNPDGILVGIGGGSICTTRIVTGTGVPQVTAVNDCALAVAHTDIPVCADGGIRHSGDIAIALAAGAHSCMVGGLIAGTDETPLQKYRLPNGEYAMDFYGMGSLRAMRESSGARQRYLQGQGPLTPEGIEGRVPYKGSVAEVISVQMGGVRKAFHSNGSRTVEELHTNARFNQVTAAGMAESHPHDVTMTVSAPNYQGRS